MNARGAADCDHFSDSKGGGYLVKKKACYRQRGEYLGRKLLMRKVFSDGRPPSSLLREELTEEETFCLRKGTESHFGQTAQWPPSGSLGTSA